MRGNDALIWNMMEYQRGMADQTQHFLKVHALAALIGRREGLDERTQHILETAAIVHDIGIRDALRRYGSDDGKYQEALGPEQAERMLLALGYERDVVERVSYLVGHHHSYMDIDGMDYRILVEADFLVNLFEKGESRETARRVLDSMMVSAAGREICEVMFSL